MATMGQTDQPVNTVVGTGSYTVPTGKWAKAVINLSARILVGVSNFTATNITVDSLYPNACIPSDKTVYVNLREGAVLTFSTVALSPSTQTTTANGGGNWTMKMNSFIYGIQALVGGSVIAESRTSIMSGNVVGSSAVSATVTLTPTTFNSTYYLISEYNKTFA